MSAATRVRILVLEDRPNDRLYLSTVLGYRGFTVLEAANGEEGLDLIAERMPDLIISDVLMPRVDGYEFVRRLRKMDGCADLPVIFYTATYHERAARQLAEECGVVDVLLKPSEPDAILAKVDATLARTRIAGAVINDDVFGRRHLQITSDALLDKIRDLEASERRMAALVELGQQFMSERDPAALLTRVCESVRLATESQMGFIAMLGNSDTEFTLMVSSGFERADAEKLRQLTVVPPSMRPIFQERRTFRGRTPHGRTQTLPWALPVSTYLLAPIVSRDVVLGVIGLSDRIGGGEFTDLDEQAATTIGVQAGIAYENAMLINRLKQQAAELSEREETTEFALAAAGIGVYERSFADNRIRSSKGLRQLLNLPSMDTMEDFASLFPADDLARIQRVIQPAIESCGAFTVDFTLNHDPARPRYVQARGQIVPNQDRQPGRLLSVLVDLTERRQLEEQLRQAQKMEAIGQLAGGVAHDFNNLLTVIQGYSRFLMESALDDEQRHDAQSIAQAGERAIGLTRQLLAFSRQQARDVVVFDVNLLITDVAGMLRRLIGDHIELVTTLGDTAGAILNDRGQIEQVVMNLVVNARDAMPRGGRVTITTDICHVHGRDWLRLRVSDTGTGMSAETKARIFEPFFTTKPAGKGTGLGLATVFSIVSQSEGHIAVDSELGIGTTFTVLLPSANAEGAVVSSQEEHVRPGTESVLLIEDDSAVQTLVAAMLRRAGYTVTIAASVDEAAAQPFHEFDMVLTDVLLPGGTGPEIVSRIRATWPDLPVLYVSGFAPDGTLDVDAFDARTAFLQKPFTAETLTNKMREILDR